MMREQIVVTTHFAKTKATIQLHSPSLKGLGASARDSSIIVLDLSARALHCLDGVGIRLVGALVDGLSRGIAKPHGAGRKTCEDIKHALHALSKSVQPGGRVDWLRYAAHRRGNRATSDKRLSRTKTAKPPGIHVSSRALDALKACVRKNSIKALHLSTRAVRSLERRKVHSIGELIDVARRGIVDLDTAGTKTLTEIGETLQSLSRSVQPNGTADWINYACQRNFLILPEKACPKLRPLQFVRALPEVARAAVESRWGSSGSLVFERYLLRDESKPVLLKEIGQDLGCTKQGASLKKEKIVRMLSEAMLDDSYCGCRFRFRDAFVAPLRRLRERLATKPDCALGYSEWQKIVARVLEVPATEIRTLESLFFGILDYHVVHPIATRFEPIILPRSRETLPFSMALTETERLLRFKFPNGLSEKQLFEKLRYSDGRAGPSLPEIPTLVNSIPGIERVKPGGRIRLRLERVSRIVDQLERILREKGSEMHIRELALELGRFKGRHGSVRSPLHVSAALNPDKRFKPIARSGFWILREWSHIETRTVAEIAAEVLGRSTKPMTEAELYRLISARRPVKIGSIGGLLREDGRFHHVGPRTWKLK